MGSSGDVSSEVGQDHVAVIDIHRPPNNLMDASLIRELADTLAQLDADKRVRAVLICSEGKNFCAGVNLKAKAGVTSDTEVEGPEAIYEQALRLFSSKKPYIAVVQGAAVGGGLGLACAADFRIASDDARFRASFAALGYHHGFGLSVTLPRIVGNQRALEMLYQGQSVDADQALRIGLADRTVGEGENLRMAAREFAAKIAEAAPLAVESIRHTMREELISDVRLAMRRENAEQERLRITRDCEEGVLASLERRAPVFIGE